MTRLINYFITRLTSKFWILGTRDTTIAVPRNLIAEKQEFWRREHDNQLFLLNIPDKNSVQVFQTMSVWELSWASVLLFRFPNFRYQFLFEGCSYSFHFIFLFFLTPNWVGKEEEGGDTSGPIITVDEDGHSTDALDKRLERKPISFILIDGGECYPVSFIRCIWSELSSNVLLDWKDLCVRF